MTARHNPRPTPSKRTRRAQRRDAAAIALLVAHAVEANPDLRASFEQATKVLTSDRFRDLQRRIAWRLGRFQPLAPGMVTWPTRRRRRRR